MTTNPKDEEIQRLRGWLDRVLYKTGCTRGQRTTQWCDEARESHEELREARAEIERLKAELQECRDLLRRFTPHCEDMNHLPEGMHDHMEPCPLERRFREAT